MSPKDEALKTVDRMKTETIHAQALQLEYLRNRLIATEDDVTRLTKENRTLQLKLMSANRIVNQQQGA
jgi:hypothetical protein